MPDTSNTYHKLLVETDQNHQVRAPLYRQIESQLREHLKQPVCLLAFFTSFNWPVAIGDRDVDMIEEVLRNTPMKGRKLALMISSPGGDGMAAERIVNVCRNYSPGGDFLAVVPKMAKSAATMICFGAAKILMSNTSELGPVDPQIAIRNDQGKVTEFQAAHELIQAYQELISKANTTRGRVEPYLQQLARFDARDIRRMKSAQQLSEDISVKCLKAGCLGKLSEAAIRRKIRPFIDPKHTIYHGRPIYAKLAQECGLNVQVLPHDGPLWESIWSLYVRLDYVVSQQPIGKVVESETIEYMARVNPGAQA